jgi:tetratricopeptide (TPR) repeat protein
MKRMMLVCIVVLVSCLIWAETDPINDYFTDPSPASFQAAYGYCADSLNVDSTQNGYKLLMATLALSEAKRLTDSVEQIAAELDTGGKFQYANLLLSWQRYGDAIPIYDELNKDYPAWSCPWRHKGEALYRTKRYKEAEASLQKAIETNLEHYDAYIWMAKTQYQLKKYKQALQNLETALTLNPEAEESLEATISSDEIHTLRQELLKKIGKK